LKTTVWKKACIEKKIKQMKT